MAMIDYFALALPHALLAYACWRLLQRADLDREEQPDQDPPPRPPAASPKGPRLRA